jgi:hypothetical protein
MPSFSKKRRGYFEGFNKKKKEKKKIILEWIIFLK